MKSKDMSPRPSRKSFNLCMETIDAFIEEVDRDGGPHLIPRTTKWAGISYRPTIKVDESLDPFSEAYTQQQIALYHEISQREVDPYINELTEFDMERHANSSNPEAISPSDLIPTYMRLSKFCSLVKMRDNARVLDMGSGWGVSSEFFATLGCRVTAVDINPRFVELTKRRSERLSNRIMTIRSSFEDFDPPEKYDVIAFHACLHHAIRPVEIIKKLSPYLNANGCIAIAGEPVQDLWWKNWGLRLDPLSIYCIRKFGWFESGWSESFIAKAFQRAGLRVETTTDLNPEIGIMMVARRDMNIACSMSIKEVTHFQSTQHWYFEEDFLTSKGNSLLHVTAAEPYPLLRLKISNYRGTYVSLKVFNEQKLPVFTGVLVPGDNEVELNYGGPQIYRLVSDAWSPNIELGSPDKRIMGFHLAGLEFLADKPRR